jgi:hypothetical protein
MAPGYSTALEIVEEDENQIVTSIILKEGT